MPAKALLPALFLLAGCPDQVGQECPPRTAAIGQYALSFQGQHDAGECSAHQPDGGGPATLLVADDGGTRISALCYGSADAGAQLYLVIPGKGARTSPLLADGGFHFTGHSDPVTGTPCVCQVAIDETFDGFLQASPPGAPFALQADGGLPEIASLTGTLVDHLSTPAGTTGCSCDLPCPVTYAIVGTRK